MVHSCPLSAQPVCARIDGRHAHVRPPTKKQPVHAIAAYDPDGIHFCVCHAQIGDIIGVSVMAVRGWHQAPLRQHRRFNESLNAGMEILQFKGMSRVLEHVHRWVEGKFYGIAQQLYGDDGSDPASAKAKLIQVRT